MLLVALYIPKFHEGTLWLRLVLFVALAVTIVLYARPRWGVLLPAAFVVVGWLVAIIPGVIVAANQDLGGYGNLCREMNNIELPDWYFAVFAYFDVGWGTAVSFAGIVVGLIMLECVGFLRSLRTKSLSE